MLFANDILLLDETARGVNAKIKTCGEALESEGFRISRRKTKYVKCRFGSSQVLVLTK